MLAIIGQSIAEGRRNWDEKDSVFIFDLGICRRDGNGKR